MASRFEEEESPPQPPECANCGAVGDLLRCSRCRTEWFCSLACHKAYWPFHRQHCRRNEFADVVEQGGGDTRFAAWLRRHGKQAVIGDAEVERLERAGRAVLGPGREEVMDGMYGRLDPKPLPPTYSPEELQRMAERARREAQQARLLSRQDAAWVALTVEPGMGMECSRYKWTQNQSHVYIYARLPERHDSSWGGGGSVWGGGDGGGASGLRVQLTPEHLAVSLLLGGGRGGAHGTSWGAGGGPMPLTAGGGRDDDSANGGGDEAEEEQEQEVEVLFGGRLFAAVKAELSTWFVDDGVLTVRLLKRCRRGHYAAGATNASTWWRSVWAAGHCPPGEALALAHPPTAYYWSEYEESDLPEESPRPPAPPHALPPPASTPPAPAAPASSALAKQLAAAQAHGGASSGQQAEAGELSAEVLPAALPGDVLRWPDGADGKQGLGKTVAGSVVTVTAAAGEGVPGI
ncbi:hypothetical protein HYH02_013074 [Chlamydomonas schloesseri]|uniref:MYND-type domain-containing protein n=1 Tax=Chlamydomonas schloesseri TaxID=2026947 RepID=A0A835SXW4_9CHLO|nr:hypothetical protein HYH02_013074 [Chlamydomonas schloesseri]|eukprot:KAG2432003.1 hypothetical protein HYH02_013074 [Chlamydomonas schloesseri]